MKVKRAVYALTFALISLSLSLSLSSSSSFSSDANRSQAPVRIFAAASLTDALAEVITGFEAQHPSIRVIPQFGGSSDLARQILAGAPADLFFSADERQMDRIETAMRADLLSNGLVVVRHRDEADDVEGPADLEKLDRIAMADSATVPAGVYARRYLEQVGLWSRLKSRVVPTLDVRGALAAVASGNVAAGFVYRTDAAIEDRVRIVYAVPKDEGPRITYPLGIVRDRDRADVRRLCDYLRSEAAREIFERFGFVVAGEVP